MNNMGTHLINCKNEKNLYLDKWTLATMCKRNWYKDNYNLPEQHKKRDYIIADLIPSEAGAKKSQISGPIIFSRVFFSMMFCF